MGDDLPQKRPADRPAISIHVPRMGDDRAAQLVPVGQPEISIHVPRMGDDRPTKGCWDRTAISIHVPRMGDDWCRGSRLPAAGQISIHVPRMGDDIGVPPLLKTGCRFLSTSPVWGTTRTRSSAFPSHDDFYPRPPYGGRRGHRLYWRRRDQISIHVPRMGDDGAGLFHHRLVVGISIHVPRMGDDTSEFVTGLFGKFLSTSPVWGTTAGPHLQGHHRR